MKSSVMRALAIVLLALPITTLATTQSVTPAKCQSIKDRIERYTVLRRKGGSAGQMQQWKQQLRISEEQFRRLDCRDHRRKLR